MLTTAIGETLRAILKATTIAVAGIVCVAFVWMLGLFVFSEDFRYGTMKVVGLSGWADQLGLKPRATTSVEEYERYNLSTDHLLILTWVQSCTKTKDLNALPQYKQAMYWGATDVGLLNQQRQAPPGVSVDRTPSPKEL